MTTFLVGLTIVLFVLIGLLRSLLRRGRPEADVDYTDDAAPPGRSPRFVDVDRPGEP